MRAVQILMDDELIAALDRVAKRLRRDRSKLVREAVTRLLASETAREKEQRVIEAYAREPLSRHEQDWLEAGEWPKD